MRARRFRPMMEQLNTRIVLDASTVASAAGDYYPGDEIDPSTIMSSDSSNNPSGTDSSGDDNSDPTNPAITLVPNMPYQS